MEEQGQALSGKDSKLPGKARGVAADKLGESPNDVDIGAPVTLDLPLTGRKLTRFKAFGKKHKTVGVSFDESGQVADAESAFAKEHAERDMLYGKKSPELHSLLSISSPATQKVAIILNFEEQTDRGPGRTISSTMSRAEMLAVPDNTETQRRSHKTATAPVRARFLAKVRRYDPSALDADPDPVVYATLTPAAIATLEQDPDVQLIQRNDMPPEPMLATSASELSYWDPPSIFAGGINLIGFDGAGIKVGMVEAYSRTSTTNPYLQSFTQDSRGTIFGTDKAHATTVAGVLKSTHSRYRGVATGIDLYVGGGNAVPTDQTLNSVIGWGAKVVNVSTSDSGATYKVWEGSVYNKNVLPVVAAGNGGNREECGYKSEYVYVPGTFHNVLTVGSLAYHGQVQYPDDDRASCYAFRTNSAHGDKIKPELVAPGYDIWSLDLADNGNPPTNLLKSTTGTSMAAPFVTGTVALMLQANPGLKSWPGLIKGMLLATARYSTYLQRGTAGYGRLKLVEAVKMAAGTLPGIWWFYATTGLSCTSFPRTYQGYLTAGKRVRVALVWDTDPNYNSVSNKQPSADLDLKVTGPDGYWVRSMDWDNTQEVTDFIPNASGNHTIEITKFRCDPKYPVKRIAYVVSQDP